MIKHLPQTRAGMTIVPLQLAAASWRASTNSSPWGKRRLVSQLNRPVSVWPFNEASNQMLVGSLELLLLTQPGGASEVV